MRLRLPAAAITVALALAAVAAPTATATAASPHPGDPKVASSHSRAAAALDRAQDVLAGHSRRTDASVALRDLWANRQALTPAERAEARPLLARPGLPSERVRCKKTICIHYTTTGRNAVSRRDVSPRNGTPDYVDLALKTVLHIHDVYVNAGYREPLPDRGKSGSNALDVYLQDDGAKGLYGYCAPDQNTPQGVYTSWSYCSFDNDFKQSQFPTNTPKTNLQVTAAHEYFHATQFSYDAYEDSWVLEATATWAEDELYPDVNDNLQYLTDGPMGQPQLPLDYAHGCCHQYGDWIFFRYLTEEFPAEQGGLPSLILDLWKRLDAKKNVGPDDYSVQGIQNVLTAHDTDLSFQLGLFAVANRYPATVYQEGQLYPTADATEVDVTSGSPDPAPFDSYMDHLSTATVRYVPEGLDDPNYVLRLDFDLAPTSRGSLALVTTELTNGHFSTDVVSLDGSGDGQSFPQFDSDNVAAVEVTLVNGGSDYECWSDGDFACSGTSNDDDLLQEVDAIAVLN
jgi:hypothetical protein